MGFVYEEQANADQMITTFCSNAFASAGATTYLALPFRAHIMEAGFIPLTVSVTSATSLLVKLGNNVTFGTSSFGSTIVSSTSFSTIAVGQMASVALSGATIGKRGDALQVVTSGGDAATGAATIYAIVRRTVDQ